MTFAVDSNVILDVLYADPRFARLSIDTLTKAASQGKLISCDAVWAETSSHFTDKSVFRKAMSEFGISYSNIPESAAVMAGELWAASRREAKRRDKKQREVITPDFLIGAHAFECADALITRDRGFLRKWFKALKIIDPSKPSAS